MTQRDPLFDMWERAPHRRCCRIIRPLHLSRGLMGRAEALVAPTSDLGTARGTPS